MHIRRFGSEFFDELECSEIAVSTPGVMASTGMEAAETVLGLCDRINPDAVIAIDALASRSPDRLGRTIQLSDTGIFPGSGIGNSRFPINEKTLGVPVIAIGVPTVINAAVLICDDHEERKVSKANLKKLEEMFVSPREIDGITYASAKIIAHGINQAFGII
jgi:spore protease